MWGSEVTRSSSAISSTAARRSVRTCDCRTGGSLRRSLEYLNKDWTYHAKGLWLFGRKGNDAVVTIGSPNFGMRSYFRDMESQLYMVSESERYILAKGEAAP